ncbi:MAG: FHA domain-containing protein, partial [Dehalococcoidia bacterium]
APIVHERVGRLDLAGGNAAQPSYVLRKSVTTIGRGPDNDIVLRDNLASRHHARVMEYSGEYFLHDLDSVNGSRVNRERLDGPVRLRSGDEIVIGSVRLLFSLVDSG